jgi:hypothetical protein
MPKTIGVLGLYFTDFADFVSATTECRKHMVFTRRGTEFGRWLTSELPGIHPEPRTAMPPRKLALET